MVKFSDQLRQEKKDIPPVKMRIGIHTGPVVVGREVDWKLNAEIYNHGL
jgi:class 3 adenylate cyclase